MERPDPPFGGPGPRGRESTPGGRVDMSAAKTPRAAVFEAHVHGWGGSRTLQPCPLTPPSSVHSPKLGAGRTRTGPRRGDPEERQVVSCHQGGWVIGTLGPHQEWPHRQGKGCCAVSFPTCSCSPPTHRGTRLSPSCVLPTQDIGPARLRPDSVSLKPSSKTKPSLARDGPAGEEARPGSQVHHSLCSLTPAMEELLKNEVEPTDLCGKGTYVPRVRPLTSPLGWPTESLAEPQGTGWGPRSPMPRQICSEVQHCHPWGHRPAWSEGGTGVPNNRVAPAVPKQPVLNKQSRTQPGSLCNPGPRPAHLGLCVSIQLGMNDVKVLCGGFTTGHVNKSHPRH